MDLGQIRLGWPGSGINFPWINQVPSPNLCFKKVAQFSLVYVWPIVILAKKNIALEKLTFELTRSLDMLNTVIIITKSLSWR